MSESHVFVCEVCGAEIHEVSQEGEEPEGLLQLGTSRSVIAEFCSWFCAAQYSLGAAAKQRENLIKELSSLKLKSEQAALRKQMYGFVVPTK
jgi:hypothetical protein